MKLALRYYRTLVAYGGMSVLGVTVAVLRYASFGLLVPFNRRVVAPIACRLLLLLCGVRVKVAFAESQSGGGVCYVFNHNSHLDLFLVPLLGLPRTRTIISEGVKRILPLHLCNLGIDVLYIPDSDKSAARVAFFRQVSEDLRANRYSVVCSPEGRHEFLREIAPFNRGVFHMAMAARAPIEQLYFDIPAAIDPLESFDMRCGVVTLRTLGRVDTRDWGLEELPERIRDVRSDYVAALVAADAEEAT